MPPRPKAPRADVIALLQEGRSDKYIGRTLRTSPMRVARIRADLDLPRYQHAVVSLEQAWAARTQPTARASTPSSSTRAPSTPPAASPSVSPTAANLRGT
ncbi:hypothetical protein [Streptomyces bangladeshensis]|uniref:Uncharacterized protein n=1 Tax=Streptomyces bangladeshensis TaxID=295352 RepID=A0ABN3BSB1_9ACTN